MDSQITKFLGPELARNRDTKSGVADRKINTQEAAQFLGLSVSTLAKMRLSGIGPRYAKLGRRVLHDVRDLEVWVEERKRTSTSQE
jgi:predicted DNA-binding transcriptional regulator AlpA